MSTVYGSNLLANTKSFAITVKNNCRTNIFTQMILLDVFQDRLETLHSLLRLEYSCLLFPRQVDLGSSGLAQGPRGHRQLRLWGSSSYGRICW
jgi:hypothetical protein